MGPNCSVAFSPRVVGVRGCVCVCVNPSPTPDPRKHAPLQMLLIPFLFPLGQAAALPPGFVPVGFPRCCAKKSCVSDPSGYFKGPRGPTAPAIPAAAAGVVHRPNFNLPVAPQE